MKALPLKEKIFFELFDSFPALFALLDEKGNIIATNKIWQREAFKRGLIARADGVGYNYLQLCDKVEGEEKDLAQKVKEGIISVIQGKKSHFSLLYNFFDLEEEKEKKILFLIYSLSTRPKLLAMLHIELPQIQSSVKITEKKSPHPEIASWYYFFEGVLLPFLNLLEGKINAELEPVRKELFKKVEEFKREHLRALHPLALLTTKEAQIALLVKEGKTSEEIAKLLNLSKHAVDFYRKRIREKLGVKGKNYPLESYLKTLFK